MTLEDFKALGFEFRDSPKWMSTEDMSYVLQLKGRSDWTTFTLGSRDEGVPEVEEWTLIESVEQVIRLLANCGVPLAVTALRKYTIDEALSEM